MGLTEVGVSFAVAGLLEIVYPLALAYYLKRSLGTDWRVFFIGCALFLASLIRIPLNNYATVAILGTDLGQYTMTMVYVFPSITAGVFEEGARYIAYRSLVKEHTLENGLMYGAGHGGIESIFLVGANVLSVGVILLTNPATIPASQLAAIEATPLYLPFVGFYERIMAIIIQISLSVVVLESFRKRDMRYLAAAILIHFALNFLVVMTMGYGILYAEMAVTGFALGLGYWTLDKYRADKLQGEGSAVG
jgi:uncharacterized membrane protein YhfC